MDRVLDRLYIGDSDDLDGDVPLRELGFSGVLDLRDGPVAAAGSATLGVPVLNVANRDGDPWTDQQVGAALKFIRLKIEHGRVLVACAAGMSRSVSIVVGYLVRCGWDAASAWQVVKLARPRATPVPTMLRCVLDAATTTETP